jgi:hypothetical protein
MRKIQNTKNYPVAAFCQKELRADPPRDFFWTSFFAGSKVKTMKRDRQQNRPPILC